MSLLQFAQYISHADLCKFLPQSFASDWPELSAPARQTQSLNPNLRSLTGSEKGRQRGTALCQLTSPGWQSSDIRKTPTHDSDKNMYGQHEL